MKQVLAIDIGGTKIASALMTPDLQLKDRRQISTVKEHTVESFTEFLTQVVEQYDESLYEGIAIGTTGTVHNGQLNALTPASLGNLASFPIMEVFTRLAKGKPVYAMNDAQAAAWAEYANCKKDNMIFITVSTGIGGGIIINGDLYQGSTHLAGHVGHTLIRLPSPMKQIYGEYAIVEDIASGTAIARATKDWEKPCTTAEVFELQKAGDKRADQIIKTAAEAVASLIANLVVTCDIRDFYLGGSVCVLTDFLDQVRAVIQAMPVQYHCNLEIVASGNDAVLVGAADYFFTRFLPRLEAEK